MGVNTDLKELVKAKNIKGVRMSLLTAISKDKNFSGSFEESWRYCLDNGISDSEIFEPHDGRDMSNDTTEDNFKKLRNQLSTNFSRERLDYVKKIGRKLYPKTEDEKITKESALRSNFLKKNRKTSSKIWMSIATALVGAFIGGIAFKDAEEESVRIVGTIVGTIIGGVAGYYLNKGRNIKD